MTVMTTVDNRLTYSTCDGDITFMGQIMTSLPISPQCSRLILLGHCFGVTKEAIIIAAGLSGKSPFSTPFNKQLDSYLQKLNWAKKSYSDCLAILHAYRML
ncbi:unnamed protein product [Allacma fusca]|uniref:Helicase-associated domain-containing protein n=1 Tax=Allacma fusca TaxID=39272 RepID=A0A8J2KV19_9HEXA|nr:unnamed protein product [Allacma fusca]